MTRILLIGLAGALGTITRYLVGLGAGRVLGTAFPYGTLIVNVAGCFLIAAVAHAAAVGTAISPTARIVLMTGFMGGLTTYSSFNLETTKLLQDGDWVAAAVNVGITLLVCFASGLLGVVAARRLVGA